MNASVEIDIRYAAQLQLSALSLGQLLIWSIFDHPPEFPEWFVARPTIIRPKTSGAIPMHLIASDLDTLRAMLPDGLTRLEPAEWDEAKIIEVWV
jgi:hypothetical protein